MGPISGLSLWGSYICPAAHWNRKSEMRDEMTISVCLKYDEDLVRLIGSDVYVC